MHLSKRKMTGYLLLTIPSILFICIIASITTLEEKVVIVLTTLFILIVSTWFYTCLDLILNDE